MKWRTELIMSLVLFSGAIANAQPVCRWLTEGSAATLLGGPVTVSARLLPSGEGSCAFSRQQGTSFYLLEITVANSALAACPPGSQKLSGIGNEAVECKSTRSSGETIDVVSSRVRAVYFTTGLTVRGKNTSAVPTSKQSVVQQVAEQVAGNLD